MLSLAFFCLACQGIVIQHQGQVHMGPHLKHNNQTISPGLKQNNQTISPGISAGPLKEVAGRLTQENASLGSKESLIGAEKLALLDVLQLSLKMKSPSANLYLGVSAALIASAVMISVFYLRYHSYHHFESDATEDEGTHEKTEDIFVNESDDAEDTASSFDDSNLASAKTKPKPKPRPGSRKWMRAGKNVDGSWKVNG